MRLLDIDLLQHGLRCKREEQNDGGADGHGESEVSCDGVTHVTRSLKWLQKQAGELNRWPMVPYNHAENKVAQEDACADKHAPGVLNQDGRKISEAEDERGQ